MRYGHKRIERTTNGNGFILHSADSGFWMRSSPFISRLAISLAPMLETVLADNTIEFWLAPEVEQESQFQISRVEVAEELQGTVGTQAFGRFDLDYELSVDNHVERLASEWLAPEVHHYRDFPLGTMALGYQVTLEGKCIDVLSVAKSQLAVNIEKASDDRASEVGLRAVGRRLCLCCSSVSVRSFRPFRIINSLRPASRGRTRAPRHDLANSRSGEP
jgi:hypothetical protein